MTRSHPLDPTILREYDIRGVVDESFGEADVRALGRAFGSLVRRGGGRSLAVGYDGRESSVRLADALIEGLISTGITVKMIGLGPTPMMYYAVHELATDGGLMITGSHNPPEYNGLKMMLGTKPFYGAQIQNLGEMTAKGDFESGEGVIEPVDLFDRYIERLARDFDPLPEDAVPIDVGWDPGNGAAGDAVAALVKKLPGRHLVINETIDGRFPNHHPDPTVEKNLEQLKALVKAENLSLGLAFDGDGDRIGAVDRHGRVVWGDQLLLVLARHLLATQPGVPIIADVKASQMLFDGIRDAGGLPEMWKTGHSLIKARMSEVGAPLAGEMSGHIFYKDRFYGHDDGLYAAIRLLNAIAAQGGDLAALRDAMPQLVNTPELRFPCAEERKNPVIEGVRARLQEQGAKIIDVDGVRVITDDGWWLLRASNTQDVLVARVESHDEAGLLRLKGLLRDQLVLSGITPPEDL
ncbi:phosphomannomutase [Iodidimonas nitroreducens]|uniref:Phosphomannomutase n=1 Tax=Iodidimonas nitroreducens TaxID=1236968 RepID=A0A5A7N4S4_9PROT|nr:phosphomannomutase/phosphoglucomutase [Iodidimonas nitroreducens]GAK33832.1 phosphomannomutase [alpha proteobacterium Q-1]GER03283.1 phosphomannomutase [Iodidimonas nitroreducens]